MWYRIGADLVVVLHFVWIVFMVVGFLLTLWAILSVWFGRGRKAEFGRRFLGWRIFRTMHLCGIVYVGALAALGKYCPLTYLENHLRSRYDAGVTYPGSFIVYYVEKIVYPHVEPLMVVAGTVLIAAFVIIVYVLRPPRRCKNQ